MSGARAAHAGAGGREGRTGLHWAVLILARLQSDRVGAFVPNPAGKVQLPCRFAARCALDALAVQSLEDAMARPALAGQINAIVHAHA